MLRERQQTALVSYLRSPSLSLTLTLTLSLSHIHSPWGRVFDFAFWSPPPSPSAVRHGPLDHFPKTPPPPLKFPRHSLQPPLLLPTTTTLVPFPHAGPMMKEEGLLSRRRFSTCGGTASLRPPHPDGRKLIRNASFGGYNELSPISLPGGCVVE